MLGKKIKKIIYLDKINDYEFEKIIVMVRDETVCANVVSIMKSYLYPPFEMGAEAKP